jgi:hypothetical protein
MLQEFDVKPSQVDRLKIELAKKTISQIEQICADNGVENYMNVEYEDVQSFMTKPLFDEFEKAKETLNL